MSQPSPQHPKDEHATTAAQGSPSVPPNNRNRTMRIIIYGLVTIVAIPVVMEIYIQRAATQTGKAWRDAFGNLGPFDEDLRKSQLKDKIVGNPDIEEILLFKLDANDKRQPPAHIARITKSLRTYTWLGVVRDFQIHVYLGIGEDPAVEEIVGPENTALSRDVIFVDERERIDNQQKARQ